MYTLSKACSASARRAPHGASCYNGPVNQATATAALIRNLKSNPVARGFAGAALALFILAIPTFLVATNVRWAFNEMRLYRYGFEQGDVVRTTGLEMGELMDVAGEIGDYFNSNQEFLDVRVVLGGEERPLFNLGEVEHMRDVKLLVVKAFRLQEAAGAYLVGYILVVLLATRGRRAGVLARWAMLGGTITVGLLVVTGLAVTVGFDQLFRGFHFLSFSQGTWTFDPSSNYLTRLFTEDFFLQATLFIAVATIVEAAAVVALAWAVRRRALGRGSRSGSN